eukprot:scaffold12613_cov110-Skeletonema_dohrnii-CCMP3373.AAC.2
MKPSKIESHKIDVSRKNVLLPLQWLNSMDKAHHHDLHSIFNRVVGFVHRIERRGVIEPQSKSNTRLALHARRSARIGPNNKSSTSIEQ